MHSPKNLFCDGSGGGIPKNSWPILSKYCKQNDAKCNDANSDKFNFLFDMMFIAN